MAWTPPVAPTGGTVALASWMTTYVINNLKAIGDPWTAYTPTYGSITIGNATVSARYLQAGKLVIGQVKITFGSTSSFSAGNLTVSLPVTPIGAGNQDVAIGPVFLKDTSASAFRTGACIVQSSGSVAFIDGGGTTVTNTAPWTWANTDILSFSFTYEAA